MISVRADWNEITLQLDPGGKLWLHDRAAEAESYYGRGEVAALLPYLQHYVEHGTLPDRTLGEKDRLLPNDITLIPTHNP